MISMEYGINMDFKKDNDIKNAEENKSLNNNENKNQINEDKSSFNSLNFGNENKNSEETVKSDVREVTEQILKDEENDAKRNSFYYIPNDYYFPLSTPSYNISCISYRNKDEKKKDESTVSDQNKNKKIKSKNPSNKDLYNIEKLEKKSKAMK